MNVAADTPSTTSSNAAPLFDTATCDHIPVGIVCGLMTTLGGIGHTLPYLIHSFTDATIVAIFVVAVELLAISFIRNRYMDTPFLSAAFQVIVGGTLVFIAGILIGST